LTAAHAAAGDSGAAGLARSGAHLSTSGLEEEGRTAAAAAEAALRPGRVTAASGATLNR